MNRLDSSHILADGRLLGTATRFTQVRRLVFGMDAASECAEDLVDLGLRRVFVVSSSHVESMVEPLARRLATAGVTVEVYAKIDVEPTVGMFHEALGAARQFDADGVVGLGGGSSLDVAKLVAAMIHSSKTVPEVLGIGLLDERQIHLACLPTTSGTGSEVSPNSILLDETDRLKKGVVSPYLVPDSAYVDPNLTVTMPESVTASTGMDALTHCIEAYANLRAHPIIDLYALGGIRLISANVLRVIADGKDLAARSAMSLGSLYGGLCLGPVNTAAVHALAYPLGGEFHIAHGLSNAILLPHVLSFNLTAATKRYADIARAMGVPDEGSDEQVAAVGLDEIRRLRSRSGTNQKLSDLGVPDDAIPRIAKAAMTVTRLLKNNVRPLKAADAEAIYRAAF